VNARAAERHVNVALIHAWAHNVFKDSEWRVHRVDADGWLAESADGRTLGTYPTERLAVAAVLDAGRRP
jgi:hypothetical protein